MPLTTDFVLNDALKILPSIPFALLCAQSIEYEDEDYVIKLNCSWSYEIRLYTEHAALVNDLGDYDDAYNAKAKIISVIEEMNLRIKEAIIVFDAEYQILNSYHFDPLGNVMYTFNSLRFSKDEVAIEYDIFSSILDDKECLKDYWLFVEVIRRDTAAKCVVLQEPGLLKTIRKRKLERIFKCSETEDYYY
jgi:hypothetical protein